MHTWGPKLDKLKLIEEATGDTPQAILDSPKLFGYAKEMAESYNILAARRTVGMSPNPIQLSEIEAFFRMYGNPSIGIHTFIELIGTMDSKFLDLSHGNKPTS